MNKGSPFREFHNEGEERNDVVVGGNVGKDFCWFVEMGKIRACVHNKGNYEILF